MPYELIASSPDQLPEIAKAILRVAASRKIFALSGELGAGKTSLIEALCQVLGVKEKISSPTFAIVNEYRSSQPVFHIDLYRLNDIREALDIGIEEYLSGNNYCFIEWPKLILPLLPEETVFIFIEVLPNYHRKVVIKNP